MVNDAGEGQRICQTNRRLAIRRGGFVGSLAAALMAASAGVWAADESPISAEVEWFAYTMAVLDLEQRKAEGDLIFASGAEPSAPANPCAGVEEPTGICPCPPTPPWVMCY